jgi:inosine-uridine nucleoside N-ribohydrolase
VSPPTPIVMDVDPGHDDAVALLMALGSPELDLLAVTTVAGNVGVDKTTRNALRVLALAGRGDVPVGVGAAAPLEGPLLTSEDIHGTSGLDGPELPEARFGPDGRDAVRLISDVLRHHPEPVTLVPVGPLTNVALLLREHPDLKDRIAGISLMGGSIGPGNTTPAAEFNILVDPEAAREVFESGLPITMCGLDVTRRAGAGPEEREHLRAAGPKGATVAELLEFVAARHESIFGVDAPPIHDAVAVAAVAHPEVLQTKPMRVEIECSGHWTRGETVCDVHGITGRQPNAEVGIGLDRDLLFGLLYRALARL